MPRPDVRERLTAADEALAARLLAAGSPAQRERLAERARAEGPDALWDDPRLVPALLGLRGVAAPSAPLFVYAVMRRFLLEIGIDDRALADYCASLVLAFGRQERGDLTREGGRRCETVAELVAEAERAEGERQFLIRVHLGDFALWLAGIFPDYIAARRARKGGPDLPYYEALGASGFRQASVHVLAARYGLGEVLRAVGEQFVPLRIALNRFSDRWMFPRNSSPDRLMRQVRDQFRLNPLQ